MDLIDNSRRRAIGILIALALILAALCGCRGAQAPASSCPPGWQRESDGDCFISGTLAPGQPLPLPSPGGTPLPVPPPLVRATSTPGADL